MEVRTQRAVVVEHVTGERLTRERERWARAYANDWRARVKSGGTSLARLGFRSIGKAAGDGLVPGRQAQRHGGPTRVRSIAWRFPGTTSGCDQIAFNDAGSLFTWGLLGNSMAESFFRSLNGNWSLDAGLRPRQTRCERSLRGPSGQRPQAALEPRSLFNH